MIRFLRLIKISFLIIISISVSAEYKLGKDYRLADNPLPIKKDGIVEVTESFWYGCYACITSIPCLLYTSPSPRDRQKSRMPSSA